MSDATGMGRPPRAGGWVTLSTLLDGGASLPTDRVLHILKGLGEILDGLHARGSVYGALSPAAIQLDSDDRPALLLIPDAEAALGGSAAYLAPEQRRGGVRVDGHADQYAVAVIAYEMLSGRHRQDGAESGAPVATFNEVELVPGRSLRPELRPGANDVLRRAIARDPINRFATVGEFVAALDRQHVVADAAVESSVWQRLPGPSVLVAVAAAIIIAAVGLVIASSAATRESIILTTESWTRTVKGWLSGSPLAALSPTPVDTRSSDVRPSARLRVPGYAAAPPSSGAGRRAASPSTSPRTNAGGRSNPLPVIVPGTGLATSPTRADEPRAGEPTSTDAPLAIGHLRVTVTEGVAAVLVNGTVRGVTPYVGSAAPGEYTVAVRGIGRGYEPASVPVAVTPGDTSSVVFSRVAR